MRALLALWEMIQSRDTRALSKHIRWGKDKHGVEALRYNSHPDRQPGGRPAPPDERLAQVIDSGALPDPKARKLEGDDLIAVARSYMQSVINGHLKEEVSGMLHSEGPRDRLALHLVPTSLSGALWLQFASAIGGDKAYRCCSECQTWFEVSPGVARRDRRVCSDACRTRAWRARQEQARRLRAAGKSLKEIARALHSDVGTVKSWVAGSQTN
jgi:hypothetical protein